ncbi:MAG TPA: prephenate dehydrogenase [Actinomycetota bacterium]|nr:prephenate dehydrogenase [Actinomycetota bacterium]
MAGRRVAVVGVGLIGGSLGLALRRIGATVVGVDRSAEALERARDLGAVDEAADLASAVAEADIVVIATPVGQIVPTVELVAASAQSGTVVTDVGSTKGPIVGGAEAILGPRLPFVGGHPMAGTEGEGVEAARADLFEGALWLLTPTERTDTDAFRTVNTLIGELGARTLALDPSAHDRLVALVSHLPYALATALASLAGRAGDERVFTAAAGTFRDVTRTAGSNPSIWRDILAANRDALLAELEAFWEELSDLRGALVDRDFDRLDGLLSRAREAKARFPAKGGRGPTRPITLDVPVQDRAGVLADVTTALGDAGINIEDLWMEHGPAAGAVRLVVDGEGAASRAEDALRARGHRVVRMGER